LRELYVKTVTYADIPVSEKTTFTAPLSGKAQDIELELTADENSEFSISVYGMELNCNVKENLLNFQENTMPLYAKDKKVRLRLIVDALGVEVFADQGQAHMCMGFLSDYNLNRLEVKSLQANTYIKKCSVSELKNIWL